MIEPEKLPDTYPQEPYAVKLYAKGDYVPVLQWRVESGALPPGIKLEEDGELRGAAERAGEFEFVVAVRDGGKPQQAVQKVFVIKGGGGAKAGVEGSGARHGEPDRWQRGGFEHDTRRYGLNV